MRQVENGAEQQGECHTGKITKDRGRHPLHNHAGILHPKDGTITELSAEAGSSQNLFQIVL